MIHLKEMHYLVEGEEDGASEVFEHLPDAIMSAKDMCHVARPDNMVRVYRLVGVVESSVEFTAIKLKEVAGTS